MCDFVMTGQLMTRKELLAYEVEKELYDLSNLDELTQIMQLIGSFIDGCDQVLVNDETIFHPAFWKEEERTKLVFSTSVVLLPYLNRAEDVLIVSIYMHSKHQGFVFQVIFNKTNLTASTRGFKQPFFIRQILPSEEI